MTNQRINKIQSFFSKPAWYIDVSTLANPFNSDVRQRGSSTYQHNPINFTVTKGSMTHQYINIIQTLFTLT